MKKVRVLLADDHPTFRNGLCRFLNEEKDFEVVAEAEDGEEAVALTKQTLPDVALIDVAMPKLNGIEAARQISEICPDTRILIISAYRYESYLTASIEAGAAGYLLKTLPVNELIGAVRLIHAGEVIFDSIAVGGILNNLVASQSEITHSDQLHKRQREILKLIAIGYSNKKIASEMGISERTVQSHLINTFRKIGVDSRIGAVLYALRQGWIMLEELPGKREP